MIEPMVTFTHNAKWITCIGNYKLLQIPGKLWYKFPYFVRYGQSEKFV